MTAGADAMPLFQSVIDAEREAEAATPTDQLLRQRGEAELFATTQTDEQYDDSAT